MGKTNPTPDWAVVIDAATEAGRAAGNAYIKKGGAANICGWMHFAYVVFEPARGACVKELKARGMGLRDRKGDWRIDDLEIFLPNNSVYCPLGGLSYVVCEAFAEVLKSNGVNALVDEIFEPIEC